MIMFCCYVPKSHHLWIPNSSSTPQGANWHSSKESKKLFWTYYIYMEQGNCWNRNHWVYEGYNICFLKYSDLSTGYLWANIPSLLWTSWFTFCCGEGIDGLQALKNDKVRKTKESRLRSMNGQGTVVRRMISAHYWLRSMETNTFLWYLAMVSANHASDDSGQVSRMKKKQKKETRTQVLKVLMAKSSLNFLFDFTRDWQTSIRYETEFEHFGARPEPT